MFLNQKANFQNERWSFFSRGVLSERDVLLTYEDQHVSFQFPPAAIPHSGFWINAIKLDILVKDQPGTSEVEDGHQTIGDKVPKSYQNPSCYNSLRGFAFQKMKA